MLNALPFIGNFLLKMHAQNCPVFILHFPCVSLLGFGCKVLYLDKGFCSGDIIAYLQDAKLPALIACPIRGKPGLGGTRALCAGRKAYRTRYTFTDGTTADLAVVPTLTRDNKNAQQHRAWLGDVPHPLESSAQQTP